jgi:uncharacterized protein (DUF2141 family)
MKKITLLSVLCLPILLAALSAFSPQKETLNKKPLKLVFRNLPDTSATIRIGVFRPQDAFPDITAVFRFYEVKPGGSKEAILEISDLEYGEYVFGCFQDINGNNTLDTNSEGFPAEPVTLSNNFVISGYAPSFSDCKVAYSEKQHEIVFEKYSGM